MLYIFLNLIFFISSTKYFDILIMDNYVDEKPWEHGCYINYRNINDGDKKYSCPKSINSSDL